MGPAWVDSLGPVLISNLLARQRVMLVINPPVGCYYFLPGARLSSQFQSVTVIDRCQFLLLGEQRHVCVCVCVCAFVPAEL